MPRRFRACLCLLALAGPVRSARSDPPAAPPAAPAPDASDTGEATARAEARVKELAAEAQKARAEVERALNDGKRDPTTAAVKAALEKASDVDRRLQAAQDELDRLRDDRGHRIDEAQRVCVEKADDVVRARKALAGVQSGGRPEAEVVAAKARVAEAQQALRDAQAALVALPAPAEPRTRPDYFDRLLARATDRAELLAQGAKSAGEAAAAVEATGDPVQIALFYERATKLQERADEARDVLALIRSLLDAARPAPAPKPAEPAGGGGPTVPRSR